MTPDKFMESYEKYGSIRAVGRIEGVTYSEARKASLEARKLGWLPDQSPGRKSNAEIKKPSIEGRVRAIQTRAFELPKKGKVNRYIFTSAQNNTRLHKPLWENLLALAEHYGAQIHIGRFTYSKLGLGAKGDKANFVTKQSQNLQGTDTMVWAEELDNYVNDERCEIAPSLVWCGEWQRLPTTMRPLSGFETYTGRKSAIFPHVKMDMVSVASGKYEPTKFNFCTGTVTMRNYIQKGAGLRAEFHHHYGALLVEVDSDGIWFTRQLNADSEGTIHDLDLRIADGEVTTGNSIEAITWGDIHVSQRDLTVEKLSSEMVKVLRPRYQFFHDVLDFRSRNHHERFDPFKQFKRYTDGQDNVRDEVQITMDYIEERAIEAEDVGGEVIVVDSNHDRALEQWLRERDWRHDPVNMVFFMESVLAKLISIQDLDECFHMVRYWWFELADDFRPTNVMFLDEDESFIICEDANGGIECGMHGNLGINGSRGGSAQFAKMGRKANVGHSHAAGIHDGVLTAGTSSNLDMGYNRGPSTWSHNHILTYPNGKRSLSSMFAGKWRA